MKKRYYEYNCKVLCDYDAFFCLAKYALLFCQTGRLKIPGFFTIFSLLFAVSITAFGQASNSKPVQNTNQNVSNNNPKTATDTDATTEIKPTENTKTESLTGGTKPKSPPDYHDHVIVTGVYNLQYKDAESAEKREAGLNDIIIVRVENLEELVKTSKCVEGKFDLPKPCVEKDIVLFINGREIKGLEPESGAPKLDTVLTSNNVNQTENKNTEITSNGELRYHLQRSIDDSESGSDNREHWADLLGLRLDAPDFSGWRKRQIELSVGLSDDYPIKTLVKADAIKQDKQFWLIRIRGWWFVIWTIISLIMIAGLILLAMRSDLLRDRAPVLWKQVKPHSLSTFQAAWWFSLIFLSFIFIWLVTGQNDFSPTALILLSIGLGTALGANIIDVNKRNASSNTQSGTEKLKLHLSEKEKLEAELDALHKAQTLDEAAISTKKGEYQDKILEIRRDFPNAIGPAHEGFLIDILSDVNGVSFHRFQVFVWTIILGLFFIISALGRLSMPQFSEMLLALMGISAGTYLGFKIPENNNTPTQPVETSNGNAGSSGG